MRINKLFLGLVLAGACTPVFANLGNGAYLGLGGDYVQTKFSLNTTNNLTNTTVSNSATENDFLGHVMLGYGSTLNCSPYYLGFELGTYFPNITTSVTRPGVSLTAQTFQNQMKLRNYFTADFTPGIHLGSSFLLYGRIGYSYARGTLGQTATLNVPGFSDNENLSGVRVGASVDYAITNNLSAGLDYVYTRYQKFSNTFSNPQFSNISFSFRPTTQDVGVHLRYNFNAC